MTSSSSQTKYCPVCGQSYKDYPQHCSFCGWVLNSAPVINHDPTIEAQEIENDRMERELRQGQFCDAALVLTWQSSSFDQAQFDKITSGFYTQGFEQQKLLYEQSYRANFLTPALNARALMEAISAVGMLQCSDFYVLDTGPDQLTLARVYHENDQVCAQFRTIPWNLDPHWHHHPRRALALVAGYAALNAEEIGRQIGEALKGLGATQPPTLLLSSRLFGGKHNETVLDAARLAGCQVEHNPYLIGQAGDFKSYLLSWVERAPIRQEIALAAVRVTPEGHVTKEFIPLFKRGVFLDSNTSQWVKIRSMNDQKDEVDIVIVSREGEYSDPLLKQAWKATLHYRQEAIINFRLKRGTPMEVSGIQVSPSSLVLRDLLESTPAHISASPPGLDLVLIVDTVARETTLRKRCTLAIETLRELEKLMGADRICYTVLAYGDHKPTGHENPPDWINPLRLIKWKSFTAILPFLEHLYPTDMMECDYESALDEALLELTYLNWHSEASRCVLTIGQRPPHPLTPKPDCRQAGSRKGLNWVGLIRNLRDQIKATSITVVCPFEWGSGEGYNRGEPTHARDYAEEFWNAFGYSENINFVTASAVQLAQKIVGRVSKPGNGLRLPVLTE